jgi:hypothetical protein
VQILDSEQWEHYKEIAAKEIGRQGGRYLARGASPEVREADWKQPEDRGHNSGYQHHRLPVIRQRCRVGAKMDGGPRQPGGLEEGHR